MTVPRKRISTHAHAAAFVKVDDKMVRVDYNDIRFIEVAKNHLVFHTLGGDHIINKKIKDVEDNMPAHLVRVHNIFIINLHAIECTSATHVVIDGTRIPVGDKFREEFDEKIKDNLG